MPRWLALAALAGVSTAAAFAAAGCAGARPAPPPPTQPACLAPLRASIERAASLRAEGRVDRALRVLDRATSACAAGAELAWAARLDALVALGRDEEARSLAREVLADRRAPGEARRAAERAERARTAEKDPRDRVTVALALRAKGEERAAREELDRAQAMLERKSGAGRPVVLVGEPDAPVGAPIATASVWPGGERVLVAFDGDWARVVPGGDGRIVRVDGGWIALGAPAVLALDGSSALRVVPGTWTEAARAGSAYVLLGPKGAAVLDARGEVTASHDFARPGGRIQGGYVIAPLAGDEWGLLGLPGLQSVQRVRSLTPPVVRGKRVATTEAFNDRATIVLVQRIPNGKQLLRKVLGDASPHGLRLALAERNDTLGLVATADVLRVDAVTGKARVVQRWPAAVSLPPPADWIALTPDGKTVCTGRGSAGWTHGEDRAHACFRSSSGEGLVIDPPADGRFYAELDGARRGFALAPDEKSAAFFYRDPNVPAGEASPSLLVVVDRERGRVLRRWDLGTREPDAWVGFSPQGTVILRTPGEATIGFRPTDGARVDLVERLPVRLEPRLRRAGVLVPGWSTNCFDPIAGLFQKTGCREPPSSSAGGRSPRIEVGGLAFDLEVHPSALEARVDGTPFGTLVPTSRRQVVALLANGTFDVRGDPDRAFVFCRFGDELAPAAVCEERAAAPGAWPHATRHPADAARAPEP